MASIIRAIVQLAITSKVIAISFENILKSLPTDIPADFKTMMLKMYSKHSDNYATPNLDDFTVDFKMMSLLNKRKSHAPMTKTTVSMKKSVTGYKNLVATTIKPMTRTLKPVKPKHKPARSGTTIATESKPGTPLPHKVSTTVKPAKEKTKWLPSPPPLRQVPLPGMSIPMPIPIPMPIYPRVPVLMQMRTYFEPVTHDHPPLHRIKELIKADEKKWNKNKKECDVTVEMYESSVETSDSDRSGDSSSFSDSDSSSSEYMDIGSEYSDDFI